MAFETKTAHNSISDRLSKFGREVVGVFQGTTIRHPGLGASPAALRQFEQRQGVPMRDMAREAPEDIVEDDATQLASVTPLRGETGDPFIKPSNVDPKVVGQLNAPDTFGKPGSPNITLQHDPSPVSPLAQERI